MAAMKGVLDGVRVVDMGHVVAVPSGASVLADWGAEVIKVEPVTGEWIRSYRGHMEADPVVEIDGREINWIVELYNRGKKGVALDLRREKGREAIHRLVKTADVFVSNYEVSTLARLGLDYGTLSGIQPRLIYAVLTGFGAAGPDKDQRGYDQLLWGRAGLSESITDPAAPLVILRPAMCDRIAGDQMVMGILGALRWRDRTGEGQKLELSLFHAALWTLGLDVQPALLGVEPRKWDRTRTKNPLANVYRTRDGRWIMLAMIKPEADWPGFCRALGLPQLETDRRFAAEAQRSERCSELIALLDEAFAGRDLEEWERRLRENGCIYGRVQNFMEAARDEQAIANEFFVEVPHPDVGKMKYLRTPVGFSRASTAVRGRAPRLGEHTDEVLESIGYTRAEIDELRREKVIV